MEVKKIVINSDGFKLYGEIYIPEVKKKPLPVVCLCHGIPAATYNPEERGWAIMAERFCNAGFVSLIFNSRGAGLSEGNFDMLDWANDLTAALEVLYAVDVVDEQKVYLLGSSGGAATCVYVAAHDKRIAAVATLACPAFFSFIKGDQSAAVIAHFRNIGIIKDKDFPVSLETWLRNFETVSSVHWIDKISPRPLLLIHGDKDDVVPVEQAQQLYQLAGEPKELKIISGAGHRLRLEDKAVNTALAWLRNKAGLGL